MYLNSMESLQYGVHINIYVLLVNLWTSLFYGYFFCIKQPSRQEKKKKKEINGRSKTWLVYLENKTKAK